MQTLFFCTHRTGIAEGAVLLSGFSMRKETEISAQTEFTPDAECSEKYEKGEGFN